MEEITYKILAEIEDVHWWHRSRRKLVDHYFKKYRLGNFQHGLDVGAGTGGNLNLINKYCSQTTGVEFSQTAVDLGTKSYPHLNLTQGDANHLEDYFKPETFDLATIFCVLCHSAIQDETDVLKQINKIMMPGGYLLITEPAFKILKRKHDNFGHAIRRYHSKHMRSMLSAAGFEVIDSTYFCGFGFIPALLLSIKDRIVKSDASDDNLGTFSVETNTSKFINTTMEFCMGVERQILKLTRKIPFGVTLLCLARKPKDTP
jgi:ubiquinone/menaquinone biosynthesis C-methylase UbiE